MFFAFTCADHRFVIAKRERGSTGCRTKREAESYVRKKLADYAAELSSPETAKVTVKDLVDDVLVRNKNNGNKSVSDDESRWRNHLRPFFGHLRVAQVSSNLIRADAAQGTFCSPLQYVEREQCPARVSSGRAVPSTFPRVCS
jgi:hypothetical protein